MRLVVIAILVAVGLRGLLGVYRSLEDISQTMDYLQGAEPWW